MKRGPQPGTPVSGQQSYVEKAHAAWGETPPEEILALAEAADARTGKAAAEAIGYTGAVVSAVVANKYKGDLQAVFARIRGAYMGERVACPILGGIPRNACMDHQKRSYSAANSQSARLYQACKRCPNAGAAA